MFTLSVNQQENRKLLNRVRTVALLCMVFLTSIIAALIAGIAMDSLGSDPADTLKAAGATFIATMGIGMGVISLLDKSGGGDPDDESPT